MSRLLREIKQQDKAAAAALEEAKLRTDSDIQSLTREELHELLPGNKKFQLRRTIFEIIHKQKPVDQVLKELKEFIPRESLRDALTNNGVLVDYLHILKDMKTQMNHVQSFLDAHICLLEEFNTNPPNQQSATCGPDPVSHNGQPDGLQQGAPDSLPGPSTSDASGEMKPQTGPTGGHPQGPQSTSHSATDGPRESHNGQSDGIAHGARGTLDDSDEMEDLTGQTGGYPQGQQSTSTSATDDQVQSLNDQTDGGPQRAQGPSTSATDGPEESHNCQSDGGPQRAPGDEWNLIEAEVGPEGAPGTSTSATDDPMDSNNGPTDGGPQGARDSLPGTGTSDARGEMKPNTDQTGSDTQRSWYNPFGIKIGKQQQSSGPSTAATDDLMEPEAGPQRAPAKLKYRMVVSGKTFSAHLNLMQRVKNQVQNQLQLVERDQDHEITFLFCPICSRVASDVEAAMTDVKDDKPVILVLMYHTREVKYTSSLKTWHDNNKVVLFVNVFYHETIKGLLKCEENNAAVSKIQNKLLECFFPGSIDSRGNPQGMGAGGLTRKTSGRGGGNYRGSDVGSSSSGLSKWFTVGKPSWWSGE